MSQLPPDAIETIARRSLLAAFGDGVIAHSPLTTAVYTVPDDDVERMLVTVHVPVLTSTLPREQRFAANSAFVRETTTAGDKRFFGMEFRTRSEPDLAAA